MGEGGSGHPSLLVGHHAIECARMRDGQSAREWSYSNNRKLCGALNADAPGKRHSGYQWATRQIYRLKHDRKSDRPGTLSDSQFCKLFNYFTSSLFGTSAYLFVLVKYCSSMYLLMNLRHSRGEFTNVRSRACLHRYFQINEAKFYFVIR